MNKKTKIFLILAVPVLLAILDQLFKFLIIKAIPLHHYVQIINDFFSLTYLQNKGIAFGFFQNAEFLFTITSAAIIIFILLLNFYKNTNTLFLFSTCVIAGGALGNLIDRILRGFVVDYIYISIFPAVFNFADACITIGAFILAINCILGVKQLN